MHRLKSVTAVAALAAVAACSANAGASADPLPLARGVFLETGAECSSLRYGVNPPPLEYLGDKFLSWISGSEPVAFVAMPITSVTMVDGNNYEVALRLVGVPARAGVSPDQTMVFNTTNDKEFSFPNGDGKTYRWCADKIPV